MGADKAIGKRRISKRRVEGRKDFFCTQGTRFPVELVCQHGKLGDEFQIDNAAGLQLEIPIIGRRLFLIDEVAHLAHILGDLLHVTGRDKNLVDLASDVIHKRLVAMNRARTGQGHVFPCPCFAALILAEGFDVGGNRSLVAGRAQPHIDFVEHALRRWRRKCRNEPLGQANIILRRSQRLFTV